MEEKNEIIGVCGIVCTGCDILEASTDKEIAQSIVDCGLKKRGILR